MSDQKRKYAGTVNVFQGCGTMELPTAERIAASWFFIKAIAGNTLPGATLPFGKYSCCTYTSGYPTGYGNNCPNSCSWDLRHFVKVPRFFALSHFHQSGTGAIGIYYNFARLTPYFGERPADEGEEIADEKGRPGYYRVTLGNGITCETTTDRSAAYHRMNFGKTGGRLLLNLSGNGLRSEWSGQCAHDASGVAEIVSPTEIRASVVIDGVTHHFNFRVKHAHVVGFVKDYQPVEGRKTEFALDANVSFAGAVFAVDDGETVTVSTLSESLRNPDAAAADASAAGTNEFDAVADKAFDEWESLLSRIEIEGADDREKEIFYSNLYHSLVKPADRPNDSPIWPEEEFTLDLCTMWDIYKTQLPLLFTLYPEIGQKIVATFFNNARATGRFPHTLLLAGDMIDHSGQAVLLAEHSICDAYWRGIPADYRAGMDLILRNIKTRPQFASMTDVTSMPPLTHWLDMCEACGDVAEMARDLGMNDAAEFLEPIAARWSEAFDKTTGLLINEGHYYYEGNYWNYSFRLLRHMKERVAICGGDDAYLALLDRFFGFTKPELTDARFEGFNNESDMEAPYAYHAVGRMDRLAQVVDAGNTFMFTTGRGGIPGNNDSGGLSACYLWNAMGVFPAAGQNKMLIGSPRFPKVTLHLPGGRDFVIEKVGTGITVVGATLDGEDLPDFSFTASRMMQGGRLVLKTE